ncbi:flagellar filament capping protein FliD [Paenibacillus sp. MBLB4367]|uniref:flagellar filament capping protein FliD n=1 Tax=Paenibacillus sp. MBLB4367 TaxID=3384767 RepID=UPI003907FCA5
MRISGLASGMDIDEMVSKLMKANRVPLDKLSQKKKYMEWQRDDYRTLNMKALDMKNAAFNLKLQSAYSARKASVSDENTVSVTPTQGTNEGLYTIKVNQLAKSASIATGPLTGVANGKDPLSKLGLTAETSLTVSGEKGTATIMLKPTDTVSGLVSEINARANVTGVKASYDEAMNRLFFVSSNTGSTSKVQLSMRSTTEGTGQNLLNTVLKLPASGAPTDPVATPMADKGQLLTGSVSFSPDKDSALIDSKLTAEQILKISVSDVAAPYEFKVSSTTTVGKLINDINSSELGKTGVSAYLNSDGKIAFFNPDDSKTISFANASTDGSDLLGKLGLDGVVSSTNDIDYSQYTAGGKDAIIEFNGITAQYKSNTFTVNGMSVTAKKEGGPEVNVSITQDIDSTFNTIKAFVDKYNEFIGAVNTKLTEKKNREYTPLTDEQKKDMKEDDIKRWEEKARSGSLRNDSLFTNGLLTIRNAINQQVDGLPTGDLKQLSEIGIGTTLVSGSAISGNYFENGKLYIDEKKLRKALSDNPDQVMNIFTKDDGNKTTDGGDGIATRLYEKFDAMFKQISNKAGTSDSIETNFTMGKEMLDINKKINELSTKMETLETRYYKQFTAMEKYLSQMNTQSSWLSQQFAAK